MTGVPSIAPPQVDNIPPLLKGLDRWVAWRAGPQKPNGKFAKFPVDPTCGRPVSARDRKNWLSFAVAIDAARKGVADGVGIVLADDQPIHVAGRQLYLAAIDLDSCLSGMNEWERLWRALDRPYVEVSPSGAGLRMFGLSAMVLKGGNAGEGRELYLGGRFMTVTGTSGRGEVKDISAPLAALEDEWWPNRSMPAPKLSALVSPVRAETPTNVADVLGMLACVSPDVPYGQWRDTIWAIASTGWASAAQIAHRWSALAPHRYDPAGVDKLVASFDPQGGVTLGTLVHHARQNGWTCKLQLSSLATPPLPPPLQPSSPVVPPLPLAALPVAGKLLTAAQIKALPSTPYLVRGLLPAKGLAAIYGEPSSGKTFLALDLAHAVATGRGLWFGLQLNQSPVAYVALEGEGGLRKRLGALEQHTQIACVDALRFWCSNFALLIEDEVNALADVIVATLGTGAVVFIDTLNQAAPGADENTSQDMGRIIAGAKRLAGKVDGLVVLVHHAGKNRSLGLRGHSSLLAAMDAVVEVIAEPSRKRWRAAKVKDDSGDLARDFVLKPYQVGHDTFGPETSCAVEQTAHVSGPVKKPIISKHQKAAIAVLKPLLSAGQPLEYKIATTTVASVLTTARGRAHDRAKEAIDALIRAGHLSANDKGLSLVF